MEKCPSSIIPPEHREGNDVELTMFYHSLSFWGREGGGAPPRAVGFFYLFPLPI